MKKVSILTFHASHNYGSCLQAYALQDIITGLNFDCEIINFRTDRQKDLYTVFTKRKGVKYILKNAAHLLHWRALYEKYNRFEDFICHYLPLSDKEYHTLTELENQNFDTDFFVVGRDQIWNPIPADFDWAYYLPFVHDKKKISYAPSLGQLSSTGTKAQEEKIKHLVSQFDVVSVRERGSVERLKALLGNDVNISLVLDPTLLLSTKKWKELIDETPLVQGEYILLYTLFSNPMINKIAKKFSKVLKMPIVITNFSNQYDIFTPYKKKFNVGPLEFLNLLYHSKFVLATSFHGTVFSILFNKPFFAIDGIKDARIEHLLKTCELEDRSIDLSNFEEKVLTSLEISFDKVDDLLNEERNRSLAFLKNALEVDEE